MKKALLLICFLFAACMLQAQVSSLQKDLEALYTRSGDTESLAGKRQILEQMEQRMASAKKPAHPTIAQAYVALVKAEVLRLEAKPGESLSLLQEALQALDEKETGNEDSQYARSSLYQVIGALLFEGGAYGEAIGYYQKAHELMEKMADTPVLYKAVNLMNLGVAYRQLGETSLAEDYYQRSLDLFQESHSENSVYYPYLLSNLSSLYQQQGALQDALYFGVLALEKTAKDAPGRTPMLVTCAGACCNLGQFARAEELLDEASALIGRVGATAQWITTYRQMRINLYILTGRLKESIAMGEELQKHLQQQQPFNPAASSALYQTMASQAQLLGRNEDALAYMLQAMDIYEKAYGSDNDKYVSMLYWCGGYMENLGQKEDGKKVREAARGWLESKYGANSSYVASLLDPQPEGFEARVKSLSDGIRADMAAGRTQDALAKADESVLLYRQAGRGGVGFLSLLALRAAVIEVSGDTRALADAAAQYNDELRRDMKVNLSYMTEEEREQYYASVIPSVHYAYLTYQDPSLAGPIYDALLLRKNFLLGAGIGLEQMIRDSGDTALQQTLARMKTLRSGPAQDTTLPARERHAAKEEADSLENVLIRRSHDYGDFLALAGIGWKDVRQALGPDEVAVEYIQSGTQKVPVYSMLVLRKDWEQPLSILLTSDEDHLIETVADPAYAEGVYGIPDMYNVFWKPLEAYVKPGDKVYFAMDGFLNAFAFEHFLTADGDRAMDRMELHRVSSTRELINRKTAATEHSAALFGGFDYNLSSEEVSYYASETRSGASGEEWGYLPGTLEEVEAADRILQGSLDVSLYTGEEGLESRFKALSGVAPDLLHVATHGYYEDGDSDPMERSGLVFSGANALREEGPAESGEDGLLKSSEIALLDLRGTELVVLSACQSGVGSISSDGVYGLQRAFKKAGVQSILMSLWKVNDQVTARMMQLFYTNLSAGKDIRTAFQAARETLRETYPDPLLWAPFVLLES